MSLPPQNNLGVKYYYYFFKAHQHKAAGRKTRLDIQNYIIIIITFICLQKHKTDYNTTEYNMVKYVEQDRQEQKCSYCGPKQNRN